MELKSQKQDDLEYINKFSKIKVSDICKKLNIPKQNIFTGRASEEKIHKVRKQIESEYAKIYLLGVEENAETRKSSL